MEGSYQSPDPPHVTASLVLGIMYFTVELDCKENVAVSEPNN